MRGPFSKELLLQSGMLQQQTECIAIIYKHLGVLMTPTHLYWLLGQIRTVVNPGQGHNRSMRALSKGLLLQSWKATATNRMYSSDLTTFGKKCCYFFFFVRAQEPKAPVTYCDHALSGVRPSSVRLFTFSTSSPEPLDGFWWNLVGMKYSRSLTSVVVFRPDPSRGGSRAGQK